MMNFSKFKFLCRLTEAANQDIYFEMRGTEIWNSGRSLGILYWVRYNALGVSKLVNACKLPSNGKHQDRGLQGRPVYGLVQTNLSQVPVHRAWDSPIKHSDTGAWIVASFTVLSITSSYPLCRATQREPDAWGYNWTTMSLRDINIGTWFSKLGTGHKADDLIL